MRNGHNEGIRYFIKCNRNNNEYQTISNKILRSQYRMVEWQIEQKVSIYNIETNTVRTTQIPTNNERME
jgi:hypothetical protein